MILLIWFIAWLVAGEPHLSLNHPTTWAIVGAVIAYLEVATK